MTLISFNVIITFEISDLPCRRNDNTAYLLEHSSDQLSFEKNIKPQRTG